MVASAGAGLRSSGTRFLKSAKPAGVALALPAYRRNGIVYFFSSGLSKITLRTQRVTLTLLNRIGSLAKSVTTRRNRRATTSLKRNSSSLDSPLRRWSTLTQRLSVTAIGYGG